jgi:hypothetical protein
MSCKMFLGGRIGTRFSPNIRRLSLKDVGLSDTEVVRPEARRSYDETALEDMSTRGSERMKSFKVIRS